MLLTGETAFLLDSCWFVSILFINNQSAYHDAEEGLIYESDNSLILKVGPHNTYPEHAHAADEAYHFLAGEIIPIEDGLWQR